MCLQWKTSEESDWNFKILFFYTLDITIGLNWLGKLKKVSNNLFIR